MIEKIIEASVKNKFLVILATLFVIAGGLYAMARIPLDAIPDLSDVQVIILTEYPGQAPQVVEDQVTYPLTTAMLGQLDWGPVFGGYCGAILLGGAFAAVGLFASSLTRNQIIAFIIGAAICFSLTLIRLSCHGMTSPAGTK